MSTNTLSPFGQAALALDEALTRFERLVHELDQLSIESDKGFDRAVTLLDETGLCRTKMEAGMQTLVRALEDSRARNEKAAEAVAAHALRVQTRQQKSERLFARFRTLGEMAQSINTAVAQLKEQAGHIRDEEEKAVLTNRLPEVDNQLSILVNEARALVDEAHSENMRSLERNADSVHKSLAAARNRLHLLVKPQPHLSVLH